VNEMTSSTLLKIEASQAQNSVPTAMVFSRGCCSDGKE
jgi:hypothetical protein